MASIHMCFIRALDQAIVPIILGCSMSGIYLPLTLRYEIALLMIVVPFVNSSWLLCSMIPRTYPRRSISRTLNPWIVILRVGSIQHLQHLPYQVKCQFRRSSDEQGLTLPTGLIIHNPSHVTSMNEGSCARSIFTLFRQCLFYISSVSSTEPILVCQLILTDRPRLTLPRRKCSTCWI